MVEKLRMNFTLKYQYQSIVLVVRTKTQCIRLNTLLTFQCTVSLFSSFLRF